MVTSTPPAPDTYPTVTIRTPGKKIHSFGSSKQLQQAAMKWSYVVRNRRRWSEGNEARNELAQQAQTELKKYGFKDAHFQEIMAADLIEVSVPFETERKGWEVRVFPWEFMLTAAAPAPRRQPLTIVRHLACAGRQALGAPSAVKLLLVESLPRALRDKYSLKTESRLVRAKLKKSLASDSEPLPDPTRDKLRDTVSSEQPHLIHLAGFDTRQAASLMSLASEDVWEDRYLLADPYGNPDPVGPQDLARILTAGGTRPLVVACNFWNSAARIAAMTVAEGADAAIGFQDEFEDALGELFFGNFYQAWRLTGGNTLVAFKSACDYVRSHAQGLLGSGVVLWSARSITEAPTQEPAHEPDEPATNRRRGKGGRTKAAPDIPVVLDALPAVQDKIAAEKKGEANPDNSADQVLLSIVPHKELNYSLLHNGRGLFEQFKFTNLTSKQVCGLELEVRLHLGEDTFPYVRTFDLTKDSLDLAKDEDSKYEPITVPLTSRLGRSLRESIRTNLYVGVKWQNRPLHCQTYSVRLLAVDEWRDDDRDRQWLPSFVHSRDPVVVKVINFARRYLMALQDDAHASFDGYQDAAAECVDQQIRAIWHSVLQDLMLAYSNPPPTFTRDSQRLRTPSAVMSGRQGTCIDLALLLAACLEYVDIHPVIFLFAKPGHAFVGYWRAHKDYEKFMKPGGWSGEEQASTDSPEKSGGAGVQRIPWVFSGEEAYTEIMAWANSKRLIPVESTLLTDGAGFEEAREAAFDYLKKNKESFDAMIDVRRARQEHVTPLPLHWEETR